ncbi:hypothetical protein [Mesorhizobium sp. M0913]|uniref:hypothetical protein n=1 Tax=Mesorhizobium sp. M0913 TaxID=2957026 RepID=UPI003338667F
MLPVLLLISGRNAMRVALSLIATGLLLRNAVLTTPIDPIAFELSIFGKFEILGIGVLIGALSYAAPRGRRRLVAGRNFGVLALACLLFQVMAWYFYGNGMLRHVTFVGTFFAWVVLRADAGLPGLLAWFSGFAVVRFIGKISYGIYSYTRILPEDLRVERRD